MLLKNINNQPQNNDNYSYIVKTFYIIGKYITQIDFKYFMYLHKNTYLIFF